MKKIHINNDDNYATPPKFYNELNQRFNFDKQTAVDNNHAFCNKALYDAMREESIKSMNEHYEKIKYLEMWKEVKKKFNFKTTM